MSVRTSDITVMSPIKTEAHTFNLTNASAAPRDNSFLANLQGNTAENCHVINLFDLHRSIWLLRSCCVDLVLLCLSDTCFFPRSELGQLSP